MSMRHAKTLSLFELMQQYPTEESFIQYFEQNQWGDEPICTKCGCTGRITKQKNYKKGYWCGDCRSYFNAFTSTPLEHSRIRDVRKWALAAYLLMTTRKGISALQLRHELKVSYETAWYMLHRLRVACGDNLEALHGEVEIDATYISGKKKNIHSYKKLKAGRGTARKQAVLGIRERGGKVKAVVVQGENQATIHEAVLGNIEVGSTIYTDDHRGYKNLGGDHCQHERSIIQPVNT